MDTMANTEPLEASSEEAELMAELASWLADVAASAPADERERSEEDAA